MTDKIRLGVNIDHVATLRNARGGVHPDPMRAAKLALEAGADGITAHLREDRRHIMDADVRMLKRELKHPLNLEMAATNEMVDFALEIQPHAVCLVPEKREERTTEGGLEVTRHRTVLRSCSGRLRDAGIRVSFFVNPSLTQVEAAKTAGAQIVELHTGAYCEAVEDEARKGELARIQQAAEYASALGLECHAGHGLTYDTVAAVAAIPHIVELNIGHFLIGESVFLGLKESVARMRRLMDEARK